MKLLALLLCRLSTRALRRLETAIGDELTARGRNAGITKFRAFLRDPHRHSSF